MFLLGNWVVSEELISETETDWQYPKIYIILEFDFSNFSR